MQLYESIDSPSTNFSHTHISHIWKRPDGYFNMRDTPGMRFPGMDKYVFEQVFC